jgi:O-antigen ligase
MKREFPPRAHFELIAAGSGGPSGPISRLEQFRNIVLTIGLCLLLAFGPLAFGGVERWAICVLELGAALLLIIWAAGEIVLGPFEVTFAPSFVPVLLLGGLVVGQLLPNRSAYWYATWQKFLLWCAFGILLFLTTQCLRQATWRRNVALFFTVFGLIVAVFAIVQQFTSNGKIYWIVANRHGGWIYGPYVNHAHYAGLMEMLVPFPLVFAMTRCWRKPVQILFGFAALIMASTIFLSQSLGGILAFCGEVGIFAALLASRQHSRPRPPWLVLFIIFLAAWLAALRPVGLTERLANLRSPMDKADAGIRAAIVKDGFRVVREHPFFGWGLGTFSTVYPSFRSFYSKFEVNEAHNDFLQLLVETGVVGFALMTVFLVLVFRNGMYSIEHWRRDPGASTTLAALLGCTGLLIHGMSDFNMQIPANAALFVALTAIVICGAFDRDRLRQR